MTSDYMSLDDLPESAYEQLKQRLEYADERELKDLGLPKERIESLMAGREPDAYDVELAFGGIGFVEDDFGLLYKEDIEDDIVEEVNLFITDIANKYHVDLEKVFDSTLKFEFADLITDEIFIKQ